MSGPRPHLANLPPTLSCMAINSAKRKLCPAPAQVNFGFLLCADRKVLTQGWPWDYVESLYFQKDIASWPTAASRCWDFFGMFGSLNLTWPLIACQYPFSPVFLSNSTSILFPVAIYPAERLHFPGFLTPRSIGVYY